MKPAMIGSATARLMFPVDGLPVELSAMSDCGVSGCTLVPVDNDLTTAAIVVNEGMIEVVV